MVRLPRNFSTMNDSLGFKLCNFTHSSSGPWMARWCGGSAKTTDEQTSERIDEVLCAEPQRSLSQTNLHLRRWQNYIFQNV